MDAIRVSIYDPGIHLRCSFPIGSNTKYFMRNPNEQQLKVLNLLFQCVTA